MNAFGTQCEIVLAELRSGREVTNLRMIIEFGIGRLASRISDLRRRGYKIRTIRVGPARYARYILDVDVTTV